MLRFLLTVFSVFLFAQTTRAQTTDELEILKSMPRVRGVSAQEGVTDYYPIVWVRPHHPKKALRKNLEGYVIVSTTVTEQGRTDGCKVIEVVPKGYKFERAACKAFSKARYKPKKDAKGIPVSTKNVHWKSVFLLPQ